MNHFIYKLHYTQESNVCYIGYTNNLKNRVKVHRSTAKKGHQSRKDAWIRNREARGWILQLETLQVVNSVEAAKETEIQYISDFKARGFILKNSTTGGEGGTGYIHTQKAKDAMSKARKGKKHTEAWSAAIGAGNARKYMIKFPDGKVEEVFNLTAFAREHSLSAGSLLATKNGSRKQHKGFVVLEKLAA